MIFTAISPAEHAALAGVSSPPEPARIADLRLVAPGMRGRVAEALNRCWLAGLDPVVHETTRTQARQTWLHGIGRLYVPRGYEPGTVTNVADVQYGWHFFGGAVDIRSASTDWNDESFFRRCAEHFKAVGLDWGGDWPHPDMPHFQFGGVRRNGPSDVSRSLYAHAGIEAVWRAIGAAT